MGNNTSAGEVGGNLRGSLKGLKPRLSKQGLLQKFNSRTRPEQIFAVVRHAERADGAFAFWRGGRWTQTHDFSRFPLDPPLSDAGMEDGAEIGAFLGEYAEETKSKFHVVISSPYARCVQTAALICHRLGPGARLIVDQSIGEVYGPKVMGNNEPNQPVRPMTDATDFCQSLGIKLNSRTIGKWPVWPEDLKAARNRYANRFLTYLNRSEMTKRNFILVTHADCVGAALHMMPSQVGQAISAVEYGGLFLGHRAGKGAQLPGVGDSTFRGVLPAMPESPEPDLEATRDDDSPRNWGKNAPVKGKPLAAWSLLGNGGNAGRRGRSMPMPRNVTSPSGSNVSADSAGSSGWSMSGSSGSPSAATCLDEGIDGEAMPKPPRVSDGWEVKVHNMTVTQKSKREKPASVSKRIQAIAKHSAFSREKVEQLLGELSEAPLGTVYQDVEFYARSENRLTRTSCSLSTYMFGASEYDMNSDCPSRRVTTESIDVDWSQLNLGHAGRDRILSKNDGRQESEDSESDEYSPKSVTIVKAGLKLKDTSLSPRSPFSPDFTRKSSLNSEKGRGSRHKVKVQSTGSGIGQVRKAEPSKSTGSCKTGHGIIDRVDEDCIQGWESQQWERGASKQNSVPPRTKTEGNDLIFGTKPLPGVEDRQAIAGQSEIFLQPNILTHFKENSASLAGVCRPPRKRTTMETDDVYGVLGRRSLDPPRHPEPRETSLSGTPGTKIMDDRLVAALVRRPSTVANGTGRLMYSPENKKNDTVPVVVLDAQPGSPLMQRRLSRSPIRMGIEARTAAVLEPKPEPQQPRKLLPLTLSVSQQDGKIKSPAVTLLKATLPVKLNADASAARQIIIDATRPNSKAVEMSSSMLMRRRREKKAAEAAVEA